MIVYHTNINVSNLLMRNNLHAQSKLKSSNVVYEYPYEDCALRPSSFYIGYTLTTLSRTLTMHLQNEGMQSHYVDHHDRRTSNFLLLTNSDKQINFK